MANDALKVSLSATPAFGAFGMFALHRSDMLVVGCGGGPSEANLSSYLLRSSHHRWAEGCVSVEGGSGLGALAQLLESRPASFADFELGGPTSMSKAFSVLSLVKSYLISHAHLDHTAGMILSAGYAEDRKKVFASPRTLQTVLSVFSGGIWPQLAKLAARDDSCGGFAAYLCEPLTPDGIATVDLCPGLSARAMLVSHGCGPHESAYDSTAFFLVDRHTSREALFFGDVEPDSISHTPRNRLVWEQAGPRIASGVLSTMFIECSYPSDRPDSMLYGHLSPPHLMRELSVLASLVPVRDDGRAVDDMESRLQGLSVVIMHIKDELTNVNATESIHDRILRELNALEASQRLGVKFVLARQGMRMGAHCSASLAVDLIDQSSDLFEGSGNGAGVSPVMLL